MTKYNYLYLLHEREFINTNENIYKFGRTSQPIYNRIKSYPKNSIILYIREICPLDCITIEYEIIKHFKELNSCIEQKLEYGYEYFKGNYNTMIKKINEIINYYLVYRDKNRIINFLLSEQTFKKQQKCIYSFDDLYDLFKLYNNNIDCSKEKFNFELHFIFDDISKFRKLKFPIRIAKFNRYRNLNYNIYEYMVSEEIINSIVSGNDYEEFNPFIHNEFIYNSKIGNRLTRTK